MDIVTSRAVTKDNRTITEKRCFNSWHHGRHQVLATAWGTGATLNAHAVKTMVFDTRVFSK